MIVTPPMAWIPYPEKARVACLEITDRASARCHVWYSGWAPDGRFLLENGHPFCGFDKREDFRR